MDSTEPSPSQQTDSTVATDAEPVRHENPFRASPATETAHDSPVHPELGAATLGRGRSRHVKWPADHVIQMQPIVHEPNPDLAHVNHELERYRQSSGLTLSSLGDEDYDYRLDKGLTDNEKEEKKEEDTDPARDREEDTLHKILDNGADGATNYYVPLGETDGLPDRAEGAHLDDEANKIVRAHSTRWGKLRRRVNSGSVRRHARQGHFTARDPEKNDALKGGANPSLKEHGQHIETGAGILGTLLSLYTHGEETATNSAATTPQSSRPPSRAPSEDDESHSGRSPRRPFWHRRDTPPVPPSSAEDGSNLQRPGSRTSLEERDGHHSFMGSMVRRVQDYRDDRPKSARSAAGVIGALIQNSNGMAAAAAPNSVTLIPNAKRSGYHLDRYELESPPLSPPPEYIRPSRPSSAIGLGSLGPRGRSTSPRRGSGRNSPTHLPRPASTPGLSSLRDEVHIGEETNTTTTPTEEEGLLVMKRRKKPVPAPLQAVKSAEQWFTKRGSSPNLKSIEADIEKKEREKRLKMAKKSREARKRQELFIKKKVAAILARQQFLLKLARCLMAYGAPSHRLETQIQATAKVLEIPAQVVYLPGIMLVSFMDEATHTTETKFLKQTTTIDLGKLSLTHSIYWDVVHDEVPVDVASSRLDAIMATAPYYNWWQSIIIGGLCSAFIVVPSYYGSFVDALMCCALGMLVMVVQLYAVRNDLFSAIFEIAVTTLISICAAGLSSTHRLCFTAVVSGSIVTLLPGYIVLTGALELASRNITAGAVRMGYSVIYSLFLGFGISFGSEVYGLIRGEEVANATDNTCSRTHYSGAPWYQQTPSGYWYYLCVPAFALVLSMNQQQPIFRRQTFVMVAIACAGWVVNHFAGLYAFPGRSDIVSAIGAFCVGILGNFYGRFLSNGASFPVMVTGILMQLPSGLKEGGLFNFAADTNDGTFKQYSTGFSVASQLISVAIGLTVGLFCAAVVTHPLGGSRRRGAGIFSF